MFRTYILKKKFKNQENKIYNIIKKIQLVSKFILAHSFFRSLSPMRLEQKKMEVGMKLLFFVDLPCTVLLSAFLFFFKEFSSTKKKLQDSKNKYRLTSKIFTCP